jgi:hypothetical protein
VRFDRSPLGRRATAFRCLYAALDQELVWRLTAVIDRCAAAPDCHPAEGAFAAEWERESAVITTEIEARKAKAGQALDRLCHTAARHITFWTHVRGLAGHTVRHQWLYGDLRRGDIPLLLTVEHHIGGASWRVWSTKLLPAIWPGTRTVVLAGEDGRILAQYRFLSLPKER